MRAKRYHLVPLTFLAIIATMTVCGRERSFTAATKNGVRIVHNLRPAAPEAGARLEFVRQIGKLETDVKEEMFAFPIHAARDGAGNLYVLDSKDHVIKKFDRDGRFLLQFGRHGQGPGEFQYPMMVGIAGRNTLLVHGMDSAFQIFDLEGRFVDRFQMGEYEGLFMQGMGSGRVVGYAMKPGGENLRENKILKVFDLQGKVLHQFGEPLLLSRTMDSWNANFLSLAVDGKDYIYAAFTYQNRIEKYAPDGTLVMTIDRTLPFPVEHKTIMETMEIRGQAREIERLKSTLVSHGIGVDARGRMWVLTASRQIPETIARDDFIPQEYIVFEVYDPGGVLTGHVPLPEVLKSFDNFFMSGDSVFFLDPYGQCCVFEFRVAG
ncbi:MAG: 6-bladed beta-propeller [Candidatus Aminicenantes bacterium]|nr:6-bladed beta-propeller [Candidatus Aminicenantes bacterium]